MSDYVIAIFPHGDHLFDQDNKVSAIEILAISVRNDHINVGDFKRLGCNWQRTNKELKLLNK